MGAEVGSHPDPVASWTDSAATCTRTNSSSPRVQNPLLATAPTHDTEFVMTFINRHLANIVAIAFGLTAAAAGAVMLVYR